MVYSARPTLPVAGADPVLPTAPPGLVRTRGVYVLESQIPGSGVGDNFFLVADISVPAYAMIDDARATIIKPFSSTGWTGIGHIHGEITEDDFYGAQDASNHSDSLEFFLYGNSTYPGRSDGFYAGESGPNNTIIGSSSFSGSIMSAEYNTVDAVGFYDDYLINNAILPVPRTMRMVVYVVSATTAPTGVALFTVSYSIPDVSLGSVVAYADYTP